MVSVDSLSHMRHDHKLLWNSPPCLLLLLFDDGILRNVHKRENSDIKFSANVNVSSMSELAIVYFS